MKAEEEMMTVCNVNTWQKYLFCVWLMSESVYPIMTIEAYNNCRGEEMIFSIQL